MSDSAEKLVADLADLMAAVHDEDERRREYDGYSWDYHGALLIERRRVAAEKFSQTLNDYIDGRISAGRK